MAWAEDFISAVESGSVNLDSVPAREEASSKIFAVLADVSSIKTQQDDAIFRLLAACRVFMRDRRGIYQLLSIEALERFLVIAESESWVSSVREEALMCMVNSVYMRPDFVSEHLIARHFIARLLGLARTKGTFSLHRLVWKFLLVSCEAREVPQHVSCSLEAWQLIFSTLSYGFKHGKMSDNVTGARVLLLMDLIKVISVLANEMQWTAKQEEVSPDIFHYIFRLGELLLDILCFEHPRVYRLDDHLVDLKNKVTEVFMLLPGSLLAALIQQRHKETDGFGKCSLLSPVVKHLQTMMLNVRVEKTRPLSEMLPTLIVCHNLAKTGEHEILGCFKMTILPSFQPSKAYFDAHEQAKTFYFNHLKSFLTCLDTDVRRYTSEWLFLLCDQNEFLCLHFTSKSLILLSFKSASLLCRLLWSSAKVYTQHTGIGNAIGLLRMKGLA
ncbi:putative guanine nucleotide exchange factor, Ric8 [Plasmopara halstedii]